MTVIGYFCFLVLGAVCAGQCGNCLKQGNFVGAGETAFFAILCLGRCIVQLASGAIA